MGYFLIDLALFAINLYSAVMFRGSIWGWMSTAIVIWIAFTWVKMIRNY